MYDRYQNNLRLFGLERGHYQEIFLANAKFWFGELGIGLGIWQGLYQAVEGQWLRWYNAGGNWLETDAERANRQTERADRLAERLRSLGIDPDAVD
jgi:hypothetical protein